MSYLLAIAVGPVQEFIAAARRTRDLWLGSFLLSEISKAVASSVQGGGGRLIFPHPETDLTPGKEEVNVANVILAELPSGEPQDVAARAKQAAQERWRVFVKDAWQAAHDVIRKSIWDDQFDDVIECYAAWVATSGDYRVDRAKLMRLLAGRKSCRDFLPAKGRAGVPKSSLDGQRESVLKDPTREPWPERFRANLRIREGEQLDVVGVVKRMAEGKRPYPSVSRIAADPWVRGNAARLDDLIRACTDLRDKGVLRPLDTRAFPQYRAFPYEGTAVYAARHHELLEEADTTLAELAALREALSKLPEVSPYLAVLVADGDKMGAVISALEKPDINRAFSRALAGFADAARQIVQHCQGVLVYAGGDDVLALLPVDQCLQCARRLHDDFCEMLAMYGAPTLSVGIAIAHFMESLEDLLEYGRHAEKAAKRPDRNGLAVHLYKRGGAPVQVRSPWTGEPDKRLTRYAELILSEAIPGKLAYDLRKLAEVYAQWPQAIASAAMSKDVLRVIRDKQPRAGRRHMKEIEDIVHQCVRDVASLCQFSEELLVASQIAVAMRQARVRPASVAGAV